MCAVSDIWVRRDFRTALCFSVQDGRKFNYPVQNSISFKLAIRQKKMVQVENTCLCCTCRELFLLSSMMRWSMACVCSQYRWWLEWNPCTDWVARRRRKKGLGWYAMEQFTSTHRSSLLWNLFMGCSRSYTLCTGLSIVSAWTASGTYWE